MFARVSTMQGPPERTEEGIRQFQELTVATVKGLAGFKGAYLLVDRKSGKFVGITLWETEKDLQTSSAAADRLRAQGAQTAGTATPPTVEIYEVAVQP